jgi:hypothetical protein
VGPRDQSEARSQKGSLTLVRSKKPEELTDAGQKQEARRARFDCQKPEEDKLHRGVFFLLLASGFWLLASGFWLLASGFWLLASGFWLLASGFCLPN